MGNTWRRRNNRINTAVTPAIECYSYFSPLDCFFQLIELHNFIVHSLRHSAGKVLVRGVGSAKSDSVRVTLASLARLVFLRVFEGGSALLTRFGKDALLEYRVRFGDISAQVPRACSLTYLDTQGQRGGGTSKNWEQQYRLRVKKTGRPTDRPRSRPKEG